MLPQPVSSGRRRPYRKPSISASPEELWRHRLRYLFVRARVTNLAVILLTSCLFISAWLNFRYWVDQGHTISAQNDVTAALDNEEQCRLSGEVSHCEGAISASKTVENTIARPDELQRLQHLIIVPGHGVWMGKAAEDAMNESAWALEEYQSGDKARSRLQAFLRHIRRGVELADADPNSLLVFSGAATKSQTPLTESASYLSLAIMLSLLSPSSSTPSHPHTPPDSNISTYRRSTTEDYALDSYQNLLFSVARFREVTGRYPVRITVVGYAMKQRRFDDLHRGALRWPRTAGTWNYVGIDIDDAGEREDAMKGELANGYLPYLRDIYGCHGTLLDKRRSRNVHYHAFPYHASAPEIAALLDWCPPADPEGPFSAGAGAGAEAGRAPEEKPDFDEAIGDAFDREDERMGSGDTYTKIFDGPLPWDGLDRGH